jgi:DNA-binding CsgD family transcriptional regulator
VLSVALQIRHHVAMADGRMDDALDAALRSVAVFPTCPALNTVALRTLVLTLLVCDRRDEIDEYLAAGRADLEHVSEPVAPVVVAHWHQIDALLARADDDRAGLDRSAHGRLQVARRHGFALLAVDALEILGEALAQRDDTAGAARLLGAAAAERQRLGYVQRMVPDRAPLDALVAELAVSDAFAEGETLTVGDAIEYAQRARGLRGRPAFGWDSLTPTERRVVELVAEGRTNEEVARRLLMGVATVKTHLTHAYAKTGTSNRTELAARFRGK